MVINLKSPRYKIWFIAGGMFLAILEYYNGIVGSWKDLPAFDGRIQELDGWYVSFYNNLIDFYKDLMGSAGTFLYACVIMALIGTIGLISFSSDSAYLNLAGNRGSHFLIFQKGPWSFLSCDKRSVIEGDLQPDVLHAKYLSRSHPRIRISFDIVGRSVSL